MLSSSHGKARRFLCIGPSSFAFECMKPDAFQEMQAKKKPKEPGRGRRQKLKYNVAGYCLVYIPLTLVGLYQKSAGLKRKGQ